jgi:Zn-dependent metalloprotease
MKKNCDCFCCIIPPHLVDEIKSRGPQGLIQEVDPADELRKKRSDATNLFSANKGVALSLTPAGIAQRKVYNLAHGTTPNVHLARAEGNSEVADPIVNASYDNAGKVRDFYLTQYGYNSVDNHGTDLLLNVHYGSNYNNAFWDGHEMIFGDGDGRIFTFFANSLDVTGHELTHGVVQYLGGLQYNGQSGALNEHFADVFGVTIRQFYAHQTATPNTANWLIGDTVMGPSLRGQAIRSMKAPGTAYNNPLMGKDPQPADMAYYDQTTNDNNGVHINSGIPNRVFYLSAVGIGDTLKAALVWFETLKAMQNPHSDFAYFKTKILQQANLLVTAKKIPATSIVAITNAFKAVGL